SDLKIGQQATNSFANAYNTEPLMGYRSIEKTIMDMHGVDGSSDMGITLEGKLWHSTPADSTMLPTFIGYSAMIGDNSGNNPVAGFTGTATSLSGGNPSVALNPFNTTTDKDKKFRANVYVNTLNGALTVGAYTDYINYGNNLNVSATDGSSSHLSEAVQTLKFYAVYNSQWFGIGAEWFTQSMTNGELESYKATPKSNDTVTAMQTGISIFAHGTIIQNRLNIFARFDMYTPDAVYSNTTGEAFKSQFSNIGGSTFKENFMTAGLDWSPTNDKKVHFMPNIWFYQINNAIGSDALKSDNYMLYRLTFLYAF
ncbi:MAG TPA: hypothetical protein VNZ45_10610, partial [Bacteroidia bacterium]|nr:hypothetical protein [Bacteroidia bacterium]